jgi:hypothetical protein
MCLGRFQGAGAGRLGKAFAASFACAKAGFDGFRTISGVKPRAGFAGRPQGEGLTPEIVRTGWREGFKASGATH